MLLELSLIFSDKLESRYENTQSMRVLEKLGFKYYSQLNNVNYAGEVFREIAMIREK